MGEEFYTAVSNQISILHAVYISCLYKDESHHN